MERNQIFLSACLGVSLFFAGCQFIRICIWRRRMGRTTGTVLSVNTVNPEQAAANSKWAQVEYRVNGRIYVSKDPMQVSRAAQIGSKVLVCYDRSHPERVYPDPRKRLAAALAIAVVCGAAILADGMR